MGRSRVWAVLHLFFAVAAFAFATAGDVARHIKSHIGVTCDVVVKAAGEVPRSQGKAVRVRDARPK